ncbi:alkylated DNA repair protein (DNA oxidative demethylase) [Mesorhizobium albiziae]|uniref:Alkylated DNA repair protein (DNA oxidative demethylase) n=1 Tax=Neomesorhizobium albiziae TaxID=335020 RepID=A0A1I4BCD0_9HYPH|nr:alpha-ketoglutarate-dependent dioxygenase AlkB [Mesorhizobium albiziae]GLS29788.1 alkylated DNA repair dioxygenase [Mesorhizobium albiziae]SFK66492.1 alkylated DNA repair protein (DNA oxidative demethylase) [Mesorhizobium albiziae]
MQVLPRGVRHMPGYIGRDDQVALVEDIRAVVQAAPLYVPTMPRTGKPMSVRMTNCGTLGWVTDKDGGYRYQAMHPQTGAPWPAIPERLQRLWQEVSGFPHPPQACLVNFYDASARMGMHQDRDEQDFDAPVVSVSLGDSCLFRVGQTARDGQTVSFRLSSGDVVVLGGEGRLAFHGVDRIYPSTSALLRNGGRINLTLRRVTRPA